MLLGAACAVFLWEPWHGPIILSLSSAHGIDAGDLLALPLAALAVAICHAQVRAARAGAGWPPGRWIGPASALALGILLLLAGVVDKSGGGLWSRPPWNVGRRHPNPQREKRPCRSTARRT